jgi:hypothetical protein
MNPETGSLEAISIPDHIDILGKLACGAQLNMTVSNVTVGENFYELQGTTGAGTSFLRCHLILHVLDTECFTKPGSGQT